MEYLSVPPRLGSRVALSVAAPLLFLAILSPGCTRRPGTSAGEAAADTLRNGLPKAIVPQLYTWIQVWRHAIPNFAAESLAHAGSAHFDFDFAWPLGERSLARVRDSIGIEVPSPDSAYALDFDMYMDFDRDEDGKIQIEREPDSAPVLADFKADTVWRVAFCGTSCFYDGAYWLGAERFVLTGATQPNPDEGGPWCSFLEIYDLRSRALDRWIGPVVESSNFERYRSAAETAIVARLGRAGFGGAPGSSAGSRVGLTDSAGRP